MDTLKFRAVEKGANAVVAIDIDYTEFSGNRIALIINGTLVSVVPVEAVAPISQQRDDHVMSAVESPIRASQNRCYFLPEYIFWAAEIAHGNSSPISTMNHRIFINLCVEVTTYLL